MVGSYGAALLATSLAWAGLAAAADPSSMLLLTLQGGQSHTPRSSVVRNNLLSRSNVLSSNLVNAYSYYTTTLSIGTPGQNVSLIIDTGSSDLWVMAKGNPYCENAENSNVPSSQRIACNGSVSFDESASSTFQKNETTANFTISYGDGSIAEGSWAVDDVSIDGQSVKNVNFAVAEETNSTMSVFGIGLQNGESTIRTDQGGNLQPTYINFPLALKEQGIIQKVSYSLWLDDLSASSGSLLFGGVDHSRYTGDLQLVPVVNDLLVSQQASATSLSIMLHGVSAYNGQNEVADLAQFSIAALLDSGTTLSYVPEDVFNAIGTGIGGTLQQSVGLYTLACNTEGGIVFNLSGAMIQGPFSQMLLPLTNSDGSSPKDSNGNNVCALAIAPSSKQYILGDSFLRNAYVVYDLEDLQVGIAQANFSPGDSNTEAISSGIPSGTSAANYGSTSIQTAITTMSASYSSATYALFDAAGTSSSSSSSSSSSASSTAAGSSATSASSSSSSDSSSDSSSASSSATSSSNSSSSAQTSSAQTSSNQTLSTSIASSTTTSESSGASSTGQSSGSATTSSSTSASTRTSSSSTHNAAGAAGPAIYNLTPILALLTLFI